MIVEIIQGVIGGFLSERLLQKLAPARKWHQENEDELLRKNTWVETAANIVGIGTFLVFFVIMLLFDLNQSWWKVSLWFCFPVFAWLFTICLLTLPGGTVNFRKFWQAHELKHKIRFDMLLWIYILFALIGVISLWEVCF